MPADVSNGTHGRHIACVTGVTWRWSNPPCSIGPLMEHVQAVSGQGAFRGGGERGVKASGCVFPRTLLLSSSCGCALPNNLLLCFLCSYLSCATLPLDGPFLDRAAERRDVLPLLRASCCSTHVRIITVIIDVVCKEFA